MGRGRRLLDHRRILLRHLVHLVHSRIDLGEAGRLFLSGIGDVPDQTVQPRDLGNDPVKRLARLPHQPHTGGNLRLDVEMSVLISLAASAER